MIHRSVWRRREHGHPFDRALAPPLPVGEEALRAEVWRLREEVYRLNHYRLAIAELLAAPLDELKQLLVRFTQNRP